MRIPPTQRVTKNNVRKLVSKSYKNRQYNLLVWLTNRSTYTTATCLLLFIVAGILLVITSYRICSSLEQERQNELILLLARLKQQELRQYQDEYQPKLVWEQQQRQRQRQQQNEVYEEDKELRNATITCTNSYVNRSYSNTQTTINSTILHEYGKSSCFTDRTRMVYPLSIKDNGCYMESELQRDIVHPPDNLVVLHNNNRSYCRFFQLMINVSNIHSVRYGGENYIDVIGQVETNEIVSFGTNTFRAPIRNGQYTKLQSDNTSNIVFGNHTFIQQSNNNITSLCTYTIPGTSIFVRRKDYVNLFHAMTNWFNIWLAIDSINAQQQQVGRPILNVTNLIFLDAHPMGHLDDVWSTLFTNYTYIQHYKKYRVIPHHDDLESLRNTTTLVCFEDAVFVPDEIYNDLFHAWVTKNPKECPDHIVMNRFIHYILDKFNCTTIVPKPYHILYIDRKPYRSHARSKGTNIDRRIRNLHTVAKTIRRIINTTMTISSTYTVVRLENYTFREQIELIRSATVLFGYHGAGLTHMIFMYPNTTTVIEIDHTRSGNLFGTVKNWMDQTPTIHHHILPELDRSSISDNYTIEHILPAIQKAFLRCVYNNLGKE